MITMNKNKSGSSLGGVSRKTQARNTRSVLNPSNAQNSASVGEATSSYADLVHNELEPDRAFLMPRPIPTPAGVIFQHAELSKKIDVNVNPFNAMIARPSVYNTIQTFETRQNIATGTFKMSIGQTVLGSDFSSSSGDASFWLAPDMVIGQGETLQAYGSETPIAGVSAYGAVRDPNGGYDPQVAESDGDLSTVFCWSGDWTAPSQAVTIRSNQNLAGNVNIVLTPYYNLGGAWSAGTSSASTLINANSITNVPVTLAGELGATETALLAQLSAPSVEVMGSLSFTIQTFSVWTKSLGDSVVSKTYSLFDLIGYDKHGVSALEQQYKTAARHCVTGFSCCVTNTTAEIYKGGSIAAAQLPGDSIQDLPERPEQIKSFLASRNDGKVYTGMLKRGAHYSFIPEKVQDLFFVREGSDDDLENFHLPYGVFAWEAAPIDGNNTLSVLITVKINVELITTDLSVTKFAPSQDLAQVHEIIVMLMQSFNPMSENPDHLAKVKKIARGVVNHPMFRKTVTDLLKAGIKVAPSLLALL